MKKIIHYDLFAGIGGFSLALDNVYGKSNTKHIFIERDEFCQLILEKHWPDSKIYGDINEFIRLWKENAQDAERLKTSSLPMTKEDGTEDIVAPANQITIKNGDSKIESDITQELKSGGYLKDEKQSEILGENVNVAEKQLLNFSHSITKIMMDTSTDKLTGKEEFGLKPSKTKTQNKNINFSATTAIWQNQSTKYVHTKNNSCIHEFIANANSARFQETRAKQQAAGFTREITLLTGGFPCQPFSQAGQRKGTADDRYLWPAMFESIKLIRPDWIIAENVAGLVSWSEGLVLEQVCSDLESEDYEVQPFIIPACAVNAPHRRDRVWIIANRKSGREWSSKSERNFSWESEETLGMRNRDASDSTNTGFEDLRKSQESAAEFDRKSWEQNWAEVATRLCGIFNGLSAELDKTKLKNYADLSKKIRIQDLPHLWHNFQSEEVQWKIGRFDPLQQKNYLFTVLWQLTAESRGQNNLSFESEEVQEAYLRNVWFERKIGCSPQRWEYKEQYAREHSNALSQLSHEIALATAEICKWYNQDRNPRLKALGNAIVPAVAEEIFKIIAHL